METHDDIQERNRHEQQIAARLRLATERLEDAQRERTWAIVEAHQAELSVRQIAAATGLSSSRVHQLLSSDEAREIPRWLSQQRRRDRPGQPDVPARLADELAALRRCHEWLERLDRGEQVVVNLRPETDPETEYVAFDCPRVLRVLARIIADLDELAGYPPSAAEARTEGKTAEARRAHHRRRLAEPDPPPKRLTVQEERAALWDALGRPSQKRRR